MRIVHTRLQKLEVFVILNAVPSGLQTDRGNRALDANGGAGVKQESVAVGIAHVVRFAGYAALVDVAVPTELPRVVREPTYAPELISGCAVFEAVMRQESFDCAERRIDTYLSVGCEPDCVACRDACLHFADRKTAILTDTPNVEVAVQIRTRTPCAGIDADFGIDLVDHVATGLHLINDRLLVEIGLVRNVER